MTDSTDLSVARAVAEIIATQISPAIVPTTTLAASPVNGGGTANPGDTTLYLASVAGFIPNGRLAIWDAAGERNWAITAVNAANNSVTLQTSGLAPYGITGLQAEHQPGAVVTANLMDFEAAKIGYMLAADQPVVLVYALREAGRVAAQRKTEPLYTINVEVRRTILRAEDDDIDDNDWIQLQQERVRQPLIAIQNALQSNRTFTTSLGAHAVGLGDGTGPEFTKQWGQVVVRADNEQFVGLLQCIVRGTFHTF